MTTTLVDLSDGQKINSATLATEITRASSKQTYYTIGWLADRDRVQDAYRAYAYFRWVDDILDAETTPRSAKTVFLDRQKSLLENAYRGLLPQQVSPEEQMLVDLIRNDVEKNSGLQAYLRNMMAVLVFDLERCGRTITRSELAQYTLHLSIAVTEALYFFIGHDDPSPRDETRYLAVQGANVIHMLRDTLEDIQAGYINIPGEFIDSHKLSLRELDSPAYREWVSNRIQLAQLYFKIGGQTVTRVKNLRCRLAGFAYIARFEWLLHRIEQDGCILKANYPERKSLPAVLWMLWTTLTSAIALPIMHSFIPHQPFEH